MTDSKTGGAGRDLEQAGVAVFAILAIILAAGLIPSLIVPFDATAQTPTEGGSDTRPRGTGEPTVTNALSPGESALVGGPVQLAPLPNGTDATHFIVETERPAYWRTGAYGNYTGDGWKRVPHRTAYSGPIAASGNRTIHQRVRLGRPASGLPAAWQPRSVRVMADHQPTVLVTEHTALAADRRLPAGTEYRVISVASDPTPERLAATGREYPADVRRYAELPGVTPDRVRSLTDRITRDADNPYETAVAIETWLESNKEYRLNVSHDRSRPVADQFIFEMEAGYCEYFATSMVVMLRSQGIPARYVVGYAPGTKIANDTYRVRAIDAHAWVEVYFDGVGWVRFDPTPAAERIGAERRAFAREGVTGDRRAVVGGSPGHRSLNGTEFGPWNGSGSLESESVGPRYPPYNVSLDESPVPGKRVTVQVTKDGLPVTGAAVTFNGDVVGWTDFNGQVAARVPYAERLTVDASLRPNASSAPGVTAGQPSARHGVSPGSVAGDANGLGQTPAAPPGVGTSLTGAGVTGGDGWSATPSTTPEDERTYDLPTDVTFTVEGTPAEGRSFVLIPAIQGVPVRDARVTFAGDRVGRTGDDGEITIAVPATSPDPAAVTVERGEVSATREIDLRDLQIHLVSHTLVPLPGQGATVVVTVGDRPVENARVRMGGAVVGRTNQHGELDVTLPTADATTVTAEGPYQTASRTFAGFYSFLGASVAIGLWALGTIVAVPVAVVRRRDLSVTGAPGLVASILGRFGELVGRAVGAIWDRTVRGVRFAIRGGVWLSRAVISTAILVGAAGVAAVEWAVGAAGTLATLLTMWIVGVGTLVGAVSLADLWSVPLGIARRSVALVTRGLGKAWLVVLGVIPFTGVALSDLLGIGNGFGTGETADGEVTEDAQESGTGPVVLTVRAAWRRFIRLLSLTGYRTMTPGEIARTAIERGFPPGPVETLTESFRAVEYGGQPGKRSMRERVTTAIGQLLDRPGPDDDGEPSQVGGED